jgi:transcriptional regulator PpsR
MRHPPATTEIELLTDIDAQTARRLIESASDLALVLDAGGVVLQASLQDGELARSLASIWQGKPWVDTVTDDSREKIGQLLHDALAGVPARWRQVNHPVPGAEDLPVMYAALRLPDVAPGEARVVAFGRDLRSTVLLQHRLVDAQQAMERDYWRFREAETRYRNLFQTSPEAVLVVDGLNQKILEANPAAEALAGRAGLRMVGAALPALFEAAAGDPLQALLAASRAVGRHDAVRLPLAQGRGQVDVLASAFRQDQAAFMLVRLLPVVQTAAGGLPMAVAGVRADAAVSSGLLEAYARHSPDGLVFTDPQGRILSANRAFATLAQLSGEDQARGEMLDRWLGRTGVELGVLISNLRQRGSVGLFTTGLRGEYGAVLEVEISASQVGGGDTPALAFAVRDVGRRLQGMPEDRTPNRLARSPGELTELVGRVPMKDIVSETTDLIEQLCIETALQMTQDNRALAAQLLGLSRQSLYVKLRRYGMGDLAGDNQT